MNVMQLTALENLIATYKKGGVEDEQFFKAVRNTANIGLDDIRKTKIYNMKNELRPGDMVTIDNPKVAGRVFKVRELKRVKAIVVNPDNQFESYIVPLSIVKKA